MNTYNIPRNVKGEGRILFIFSTKALIYATIGVSIGFVFYILFKTLSLNMIGIIIMGILGLLGFIIGTFKVPESNAFNITKKAGGENIDDIIIRAIKFKTKGKRIYVYKEGENNDND